nr:unnamed protein product [Callosobruchus chinensis]
MSNRPISVVEVEGRKLATAASLSKDLETITPWGFKTMVEFDSYAIKQEVPKRTLGSNEQPGSAKSLIQAFWSQHYRKHDLAHLSSIATAAGKKLGYLFRARKYFSPSNLYTLYKAQRRPNLEYWSDIWGVAAPTTLSILDAVQRRAIRLIGDPALTCHLYPLSHRHAVGDHSVF